MNAVMENQFIQGSEPAQCNIHLARSKRSARINDGFFKGESLTFMNGYSPCQPHGVLRETAEGFFFHRFFFAVVLITDILPGFLFYYQVPGFPWKAHPDLLLANAADHSDLSIKISAVLPFVILDKHYLGALFQK